jgi:hypothetical protein
MRTERENIERRMRTEREKHREVRMVTEREG